MAGWEPTGIAHDFRARATSFVLRRRRGGVCDGPQVGPSWCRLGARDTGRPPGDPSSGGRWRARGTGACGRAAWTIVHHSIGSQITHSLRED